MTFIIILGSVLTIISVALMIYYAYLRFDEKEENPSDDTIFYNFLPQYASGYFEGIVRNRYKGSERDMVEFSPRDIGYLKFYNPKKRTYNLKEIENQEVWFRKNRLIDIPKGVLSSERNILVGLPPNSEDLPDSFKNSMIGKIIMESMNKTEMNKTEMDMLRESLERAKSIMKKSGDGELSEIEFEKLDKFHDEALKILAKEKVEKKT